MTSKLAGIARFYAILQFVTGGFAVFTAVRDREGWTVIGCSLFCMSVSLAYLCRVNSARIFLAGEFVIASLGMMVAAVYVLASAGTGPALMVTTALFFAGLGAFAYVSKGAREYCRR